MIRFGFICAMFAFAVTSLSAEPTEPTLKSEKVELPDALAKELRPEFATDAFSIREGEKSALTLWFRKEIPVKATAEQVKNGLTYREIPEGSLIGLAKFEKVFIDYRKQAIPAGTYTLRIAVQPDTGDHRDTAPHADFVLLTPVADDKILEVPELKDLVKRSLKSTGGDHPGVMLLYPHFGKEADAKLVAKENGVRVLQLKRVVKADAGNSALGFSIVVAGYSKMR